MSRLCKKVVLFSAAITSKGGILHHTVTGEAIVSSPSLGTIRGIHLDWGVDAFWGIPYATVGERFSVSEMIDEPYSSNSSDDEPFNATQPGPWCHQPPDPTMSAALMPPMDEECLSLNLWRPSNHSSNGPLSTMVWIHGGAFDYGSGAQYDGGSPVMFTATQNVIFVSFNYRLGTLGFLVKDENGTGGMNGVEDQINALKWIQRHIGSFGGSKDDVTIFGSSAGALSAAALSVSPLAKGLFQRAILQSGPGTGGWAPAPSQVGYAMSQQHYLRGFNVTSWEDLVDRDAFSAEDIIAQSPALDDIQQYWPYQQPRWTVDNRVISDLPEILFQNASNVHPTDMIIGSTSYDGFLIFFLDEIQDFWQDGRLLTTLQEVFGNVTGRHIYDEYYLPNSGFEDSDLATFLQIDGDYQIRCPSRQLATLLSKSLEGNVYLYNFAEFANTDFLMSATNGNVPQVNLTTWASHAAEMAFLFGWGYAPRSLEDSTPVFTLAQLALSQDMQTRWANFAKTGDPNYPVVVVPWMPVTVDESEAAVEAPSLMLQSNTRMLIPSEKSEKAKQCSLFIGLYDEIEEQYTADLWSDGEGVAIDEVAESEEDDSASNAISYSAIKPIVLLLILLLQY